jgi:hypothetical protein
MLKNISEKEFIEIIGYRSYLHFCKTTFNKIRQSKEFKQSKGSLFFTSMFFEVAENLYLIVEATINKEKSPILNFGIEKLIISDNKERLMNLLLDQYNTMKKDKEDNITG